MENTDKKIIFTEDIRKDYKDNGIVVRAVRGIDLTIKKGEFTAIVGPSGSGKTTFLNVISGLDTPTGGNPGTSSKGMATESSSPSASPLRPDPRTRWTSGGSGIRSATASRAASSGKGTPTIRGGPRRWWPS